MILRSTLVLSLSLAALVSSCKTTDVNVDPPSGAIVLRETQVIRSGETFDGKGRVYAADAQTLGDGSQREGQKPLFELQRGAQLGNLTIAAPAADGIHVRFDRGNGNGSTFSWAGIHDVRFSDVGEDAITAKRGAGTIEIWDCEFRQAEDKVIQLADSFTGTVRVEDSTFVNVGKAMRSGNDPASRQRLEMKGGRIERAAAGIYCSHRNATGKLNNVALVRVERPLVEKKEQTTNDERPIRERRRLGRGF